MPFVAPPNNYVECYCRYNFLWKTTDTNPNNLSLICLPWICVSPLNLVSSFLYFWCPSKSSDVCSEWLLNVDCSAHFLLKTRDPDKSCSSSTTSHPESINNFSQKTSFRPDVKSLTWWSWWCDLRATTGVRDFLKKKTLQHFFRQSKVQLQWQGQ